jgi:SAM-dependent methyltransferase
MEVQSQGIPLEEAMRQANEAFLAHAAKNEQQARDEKAQLDLRLHILRSNISLEGINFQDQEVLAEFLSKKDYLGQMVTLEKTAEANAISPQQMISLFSVTHDNKTRLAIIENLPKFENIDPEQQKACLDFLFQIATGYFSDPEEIELQFNLSKSEDTYLMKYRTDLEDEADYDLITSAAIDGISKFGPASEEKLINIFKRHLEKRANQNSESDFSVEEESEIRPTADYYDLLFLDEKKRHVDREVAAMVDLSYHYNERILEALAEVGSKKSIDFALELIQLDGDVLFMYRLMPILEKDREYSAEKIFPLLDRKNLNEWQFPSLVILLTDLIGAEAARKRINEMVVTAESAEKPDETSIDNLRYARSFMTPNHTKIAIESLRRFYQENIRFEEYGLNDQMQGKDLVFLKRLLEKEDKIMDLGCGTGRLLLPLINEGHNVSGIDFVSRHINFIKKLNPNAITFERDWHYTGLKDESFDMIYSLGRSTLHDYSLPNQAQLFRETHRILRSGGKFVFDVPAYSKATPEKLDEIWEKLQDLTEDDDSGDSVKFEEKLEELLQGYNGYEKMILGYGVEMLRRGVKNFRFGAIYDSADGINYDTRFCPDQAFIEYLAQFTGFRIVENEPYHREELPTGKGDENLYYVLEKI